ncbi:hypothetical protein J7U46_22395 [Pelomonas sp. V22]|uniref:hypothetical protein n=1 Tax=Pelomonas sp. V22 TaxID=2822139 RepID=UPI0024A9CA51|nr:hypothetical protein [Pelomonas sp. V22]MDI4635833.1 hypothetical protein [Pelomonas sp. V22]
MIGKDIIKSDEAGERKIPVAFLSSVIPAVACEAWGCDESIYRMRFCGYAPQCTDDIWKEKLSAFFEAEYTAMMENNPGPKYPSWAEARERVRKALQR